MFLVGLTMRSRSPAEDPEQQAPRRWPRLRREARAFVELFALCGLAVTQPLLDLFGRAPEQFAFRGVDGAGIVQFALIVTFAPALALWVVEAAVGLVDQRVRNGVHQALLGLLVVALALQVIAPVASGLPRLSLSLAAGAVLVVVYRRVDAVHTWLAVLAVAPVVFLGLFLAGSPTSRLMVSPEAAIIAGGAERPGPVVMVVFDELPLASLVDADGTIDGELFPHVAALADDSHWFRNTTTVSSSTWYAVPALLSGQMIQGDRAPIAADHPETLFTLLGGMVDMNVTESITRLCPTDLCGSGRSPDGRRQILRDAADVLRSRLSYGGPDADPVASLVEPTAGDPDRGAVNGGDDTGDEEEPFADFLLNQPVRVQDFLDGLVDDRPALHYLHILLPHLPFRYLPSGALYEAPDVGRTDDDWSDDEWLADLARQRHLLQVGYVDALLGEIVTVLKDRGIYDDALFVVTSDHGISFEPGGPVRGIAGQTLEGDVMADIAWVPLFVKEPGQSAGVVSDDNTLLLDVVPTIADVLGVPIPWAVDGRSLLGPPRSDGAKPFRAGEVNLFGVGLADEIRVDDTTSLWRVLRRGPQTVLGATEQPEDRWWNLGPAVALVGTRVADVPDGVLTPLEAEFVDREAFDLEADAEFVPALIQARVDGLEPGTPVAVSVNGIVAATGFAYEDIFGVGVAVMVSDERFRLGRNEIAVHRIG